MSTEQRDLLDDLGALVNCESPSADLAAVARSADVVAALGRRLTGAEPERIVLGGRTHLRWRFGGADRVLLLGHHDTVWPIGSLTEFPWRVSDGCAYGPGCFDMKAGLVQMFHALAVQKDLAGVSVLVTGDEELGAPTSRPLIEAEAQRTATVLVCEGSADGGALKTARNGIAQYELRITGRAAHAGLEPWAGVNAGIELAHQVLALAEMSAGGTTVTPTVLAAGTTANTVPGHASVHVDVRMPTRAEQRRIESVVRALRPRLAGARLEVLTGFSHPPLEPGSSSILYELAEQIAAEMGIGPLGSAHVGGASDGNIAAGTGALVLDGLGAVGGGAHSDGEHVVVTELARRTALLARLIATLSDHRGR
ncbi:MAG TPA: M20 family metallopeptidase [Jiangellales bacterium]|nr:M20 family metallopeptidase [Jiangellales bacterium]